MALQTSGSISKKDINVELKKAEVTQTSLNDSDVRQLLDVSSGQISLANGYGKSRALILRHSAISSLDKQNIVTNIDNYRVNSGIDLSEYEEIEYIIDVNVSDRLTLTNFNQTSYAALKKVTIVINANVSANSNAYRTLSFSNGHGRLSPSSNDSQPTPKQADVIGGQTIQYESTSNGSKYATIVNRPLGAIDIQIPNNSSYDVYIRRLSGVVSIFERENVTILSSRSIVKFKHTYTEAANDFGGKGGINIIYGTNDFNETSTVLGQYISHNAAKVGTTVHRSTTSWNDPITHTSLNARMEGLIERSADGSWSRRPTYIHRGRHRSTGGNLGDYSFSPLPNSNFGVHSYQSNKTWLPIPTVVGPEAVLITKYIDGRVTSTISPDEDKDGEVVNRYITRSPKPAMLASVASPITWSGKAPIIL